MYVSLLARLIVSAAFSRWRMCHPCLLSLGLLALGELIVRCHCIIASFVIHSYSSCESVGLWIPDWWRGLTIGHLHFFRAALNDSVCLSSMARCRVLQSIKYSSWLFGDSWHAKCGNSLRAEVVRSSLVDHLVLTWSLNLYLKSSTSLCIQGWCSGQVLMLIIDKVVSLRSDRLARLNISLHSRWRFSWALRR